MYSHPEAPKKSRAPSGSARPDGSALDALDHLVSGPAKRPRRLSDFQYYVKKHYSEEMKVASDLRYLVAKQAYDNATEEVRALNEMKRPSSLAVMNAVGMRYWKLENPTFRRKVRDQASEAHRAAVAKWEESRVKPKTARQFHQQVFLCYT